jgi:hypothetical protein
LQHLCMVMPSAGRHFSVWKTCLVRDELQQADVLLAPSREAAQVVCNPIGESKLAVLEQLPQSRGYQHLGVRVKQPELIVVSWQDLCVRFMPVANAGQTKTAVHHAMPLTRERDLAARVLVVVDVRLDQIKQRLQFVRVDGGGVEGHLMSL